MKKYTCLISFLIVFLISTVSIATISHWAGGEIGVDIAEWAGADLEDDITHWAGAELPSGTCTSYISNDTGTNGPIGVNYYSSHDYTGMVFDDGLSGYFCEFQLRVYNTGGDISGMKYVFEVWEIDPSTYASVSFVGRSAAVTGDNDWSNEFVTFTPSSNIAYDCTGTKKYGIKIKCLNSADADSTYGKNYIGDSLGGYIRIQINNDTGSSLTNTDVSYCVWGESGGSLTVTTSDADDHMRIVVSTMQ